MGGWGRGGGVVVADKEGGVGGVGKRRSGRRGG